MEGNLRQESMMNDTAEDREIRLQVQRRQRQQSRLNETAEHRNDRLLDRRHRHQHSILNETVGERGERLATRRRRRLEQHLAARDSFFQAGFNYNPAYNFDNHPHLTIGKMDKVCVFCGAKKWIGESPGLCCSGGKVRIPVLADPPHLIQDILTSTSTQGVHFRNNIWRFNACFAMTSFGASDGRHTRPDNTDVASSSRISDTRWKEKLYTYKIKGQCYHLMGSLRPKLGEEPKFMQVFFMGGNDELSQRCKHNSVLDRNIIAALQAMLHTTHPYVRDLKTALELLDSSPEMKLVIRADRIPAGEHPGRFNAPTTNEVAAIMVDEIHGKRDIILQHRDNRLTFVSEIHRSYDCFQYPLLFPYGEDGYYLQIHQVHPTSLTALPKKVSSMDFYAYRLMIRDGQFNQLLRFKEVTNQFLVDMYAKIEAERLLYIRTHQTKLRAVDYAHLRDAMQRDGDASNVGHRVILPSTFTGSPRYMHKRTQDAMAYVRKFGRPDLFITFTCNPYWVEIKENLFAGQRTSDRHDITARVFHRKLNKLMYLLKDEHIYGPLNAWMYTVEWQKRGLPHAHILIWCKERIRPADIDRVICAELPDPDIDPQLYSIVLANMLHGPCGALNRKKPCMQGNTCTKYYPRVFTRETCTGVGGYPIYRRRAPDFGGRTATVRRDGITYEADNSWVVPYSPFLAKIFNAHINVECCTSVKSIKYICKYINKGGDMAVVRLSDGMEQHDEINQYVMGRYISSNMAAWRIFGFEIHKCSPTVVNLDVHLENGQRVYFMEENAPLAAQQPPETTLTAFFKLCSSDDFAITLLYVDVPTYFTWTNKKWHRRRQGEALENWVGVYRSNAIGRVYNLHPKQQECFFLRMLLHLIKGPKSFDELKLFNGFICSTYREACVKHGLLEDDDHLNMALIEAAECQMPQEMRRLFCSVLLFCNVGEPLKLWDFHKDSMSEDILHRLQARAPAIGFDYNVEIYNEALIDIDKRLKAVGVFGVSHFGLPPPVLKDGVLDVEYMLEKSYNIDELTDKVAQDEPRLLPGQRQVYDRILSSVNSNEGQLFFLDAPGGTGKTFLINLLLAKLRKDSRIALAVASSGIAATLLHGGRTAHSAFKLPMDLAKKENPTCGINRGDSKGNLLSDCCLIIWDEATMSHKAAFEALDQSLKDLRRNSRIMGGATVLLAGDFRQTLPVIPRGTRADEVNACIKSSYLWQYVQKLHLTTNMRVHLHGDADSEEFSKQLLDVGNGTTPLIDEQHIRLPFGKFVSSIKELMSTVFPYLEARFLDKKWLQGRAILAPHNATVDVVNQHLLNQIPGEEVCFKSIDTNTNADDAVNYPIEFLNSQQPPGLPPHDLRLKVGVPVMLLRNVEPPELCNGTRLIIKKIGIRILTTTILSGPSAGATKLLTPMNLSPSDVPFEFTRQQFPIKVCFAMSINKAQGQSLQVVGLHLTQQVFTHGQLYVGCSRIGNPNNLFICGNPCNTRNVVYKEALQ